MKFSRILLLLAISVPCLGVSPIPRAKSLSSKKTATKNGSSTKSSKPRVSDTKTIAFLVATSKALKNNGLKVPSEDDIKKIIKTELKENYNYEDEIVNKEFCLLSDAFIGFTKKLLKSNSAPSFNYHVSISNASFIEDFFLQLLPEIAKKSEEQGSNDAADLFIKVILEKLSPSYINSIYTSFFDEPFDFSSTCTYFRKKGLFVPQNPTDPTELVYSLLKSNMDEDGVFIVHENLTLDKGAPFKNWMVLSLQNSMDSSAAAMCIQITMVMDYLSSKERKEARALMKELEPIAAKEDLYEIAQVCTLEALLSLIHEQT